jgi:WD40 repeat protein
VSLCLRLSLIDRYELKTASRLYVLEPHRAPVSSVTFSPDGRRLLTVSLEEGAVTVWKVGSSLSGFFNVGGPPRQGTLGGSGPFKRIEFARVEDGKLPFALQNMADD